MKINRCTSFLAILLTAATCLAGQGVSPGRSDLVTATEGRCPTFSWETEPGASRYEIVVYSFPADLSDQAVLASDLDLVTEVLYEHLPGGAASWTPSGAQCLPPGGRFVWFVRPVIEDFESALEVPGEWSYPRYFRVPAGPSADDVARAVEVLRQWEAENGGGWSASAAGAAPVPVAGPAAVPGSGSGSSHLKSVPTAAAAVRGEHPGTAGEVYGLVGTSASVEGAGVAAANLDGGPDLVLDGSADGETDTALWQGGLDRASASHETFAMGNSGAGRLHVSIDGDMTSDVVRTEQVVVNGMTVIDDSGDWLGNGSTVPCPSCVTSSDIADGSIIDNDLAADAVTEEKIEHGAVGTTKLQNNSVTSAKIADGTVTGVDLAAGSVVSSAILDGAIRSEDLGANTVTSPKIADGTITAADISPSAALDASTLDGQTGAFYLSASNITSGTLGTSRFSAHSDLSGEGYLGNGTNDLAQNNGTRQVNLNADLLDGEHASGFQREVLIETSTMDYWLDAYVDTCADVHSVTVTVPGPGTVVVDVDLHAWIVHETGYPELVRAHIESSPDSCPAGLHQMTKVPSDSPTGNRAIPMSYMRTFQVSSSGTYTYYLNTECVGAGCARTPDTDHVKFAVMRAMYFPD